MEDVTAEAGWLPDPAARHQYRYHDGATFTSYIADNGVVGVDNDEVRADQVPVAATPSLPLDFPPPDQPAVAPGPAAVAPSAPLGSYPPPSALGSYPPPSGYAPPPQPSGAYWPPSLAMPMPAPARRHGGMIALISVAIFEGIVIIALAVALVSANTTASSSAQPIGSTVPSTGSFSQAMGSVVYSSKFAGSEQWPTGQLNDNTSASLSNGRYAIEAWTDIHHPLVTPYGVSHRGISVDAATTDFSGSNVSMGVGCQSASGIDPALVYQLSVYPDGEWYIEEARLGGGIDVLDAGTTEALGNTATEQLTCVMTEASSDAEVTQLVAYVGGTKVAAIGHEIRNDAISGFIPILLVGSFGPTVHVSFNGLIVRNINPNSVTSEQTL